MRKDEGNAAGPRVERGSGPDEWIEEHDPELAADLRALDEMSDEEFTDWLRVVVRRGEDDPAYHAFVTGILNHMRAVDEELYREFLEPGTGHSSVHLDADEDP